MRSDLDVARVASYRETIRDGWRHNGDANVWPIKLNAAMHLFLKEFGEELLDDLVCLEAEGRTLDSIARHFYNPSRPYRIIDSVIYSMRRNRYPVSQQRHIVLKLLAMTKALKYGSEFNENGCNVVYGPDQAVTLATTLDHPIRSVSESQFVHRLCASLWAYTEAICFRAHDVTKEFHGPYCVAGGGKQVLVKEFLNLQLLELWPTVPLLPCQTIKVYQQYSNSVRFRLDALNHVYHEGGQLVPNLESCSIEVDGKWTAVGSLVGYLADIQRTVSAISCYIDSISWHERVLKYAEIFWFRKKPLSDLRGRDWRVPTSVRENIERGAANERRRVPLSDEACERLAMLTI